MDRIDAWLYINLAHRTDRRENILRVLTQLGAPPERIYRIDAIPHARGTMGATMSHIKTLDFVAEHPSWRHVVVMEDDFTVDATEVPRFHAALTELMSRPPGTWDVFLPTVGAYDRATVPETGVMHRVLRAQTTASYICSTAYAPTLRANFAEGLAHLSAEWKPDQFAIDQYWKRLQTSGTWLCTLPPLAYQLPGFSDCERCYVDYKC